MLYCQKCGKPIKDNDEFCPECGQKTKIVIEKVIKETIVEKPEVKIVKEGAELSKEEELDFVSKKAYVEEKGKMKGRDDYIREKQEQELLNEYKKRIEKGVFKIKVFIACSIAFIFMIWIFLPPAFNGIVTIAVLICILIWARQMSKLKRLLIEPNEMRELLRDPEKVRKIMKWF